MRKGRRIEARAYNADLTYHVGVGTDAEVAAVQKGRPKGGDEEKERIEALASEERG